MTSNNSNNEQELLSTQQTADILGVSRVTVFNRIKSGEIKAHKVGRSYVIPRKEIERHIGDDLTDEQKELIDTAVERTFKEYGETLRKLGKE